MPLQNNDVDSNGDDDCYDDDDDDDYIDNNYYNPNYNGDDDDHYQDDNGDEVVDYDNAIAELSNIYSLQLMYSIQFHSLPCALMHCALTKTYYRDI